MLLGAVGNHEEVAMQNQETADSQKTPRYQIGINVIYKYGYGAQYPEDIQPIGIWSFFLLNFCHLLLTIQDISLSFTEGLVLYCIYAFRFFMEYR